MAKEYLIGDFLKRIKRHVDLEPNKNYNLVTIKMNHKGVVLRGQKKGCDIKSKMFEVKEGDFILSGIDARNGAFGIVSKELEGAIVTNDFWYFEIDEKIISKQLFLELTATTWFDDICQKGSDGTTQRIRLQKRKFFNQKIFLPEGDEQKELLNKILTFKNGQTKLNKEIDSQKLLLTQLKQSILQEAIQGKLTKEWREQNPNTEPASELLKHIQVEKAQLVKEKKIKKEKALTPITKEEIPFDLPDGWAWCRLGEVSLYLNGKGFSSSDFQKKKGIKCIKITNAGVGEIIGNEDTLPEYFRDKYSDYLVYENDIVIALTRPYIADGLKVSLCTKEYNESLLNQRVAVIKGCLIDNKYIYKYLRSGFVLKGFQDEFSSKGQQPNLKTEHIRNLLFPIAPIPEQKEIVKKVEALMQHCKELEQEIETSEANAQMLIQAVLKEAFESEKEIA